jgi:LacI family transcriptional regulator, galactose operon repressor
MSVDGFIVDLPQPNDPRISYLIEVERPFVVHGRDGRSDSYAWVDIDNAGIFGALTRLMVDNGHRRIAFINGDEHFAFAAERRRGVEEALDMLGLPRDTVHIYNALHPMGDAGFKLTTAALDEKDVTAVLYSSALMAVEGHSALVRAGRKVGDNVSVATMDDELHYLDLSPFDGQFTFARSSLRDAGSALIAELIRACEQSDRREGIIIPHTFRLAAGIDGRTLD